MRPWVERVYGIPPEQVVGSQLELAIARPAFSAETAGTRALRMPEARDVIAIRPRVKKRTR
jgi:hypothetical protein